MIRSFRARLTIWNAVVIAVVLVAFSAGIVYANQARLAADIDHELADRAIHAPPFRMGPAPGGFGGGFDAGPPTGMGGFMPGPGPGPAPPPGGVPPPRFNDPAAIRFADVRRPRRFDEQGRPIGQMQDQPFDLDSLNKSLRGVSLYSNGEFDGEPIRIFTMPVRQGPDKGTFIQVARQTQDLNRIWSAQLWTLALFLPGAILGAAAGAFFLTNRATKPIGKLKQAANAINEQDLSRRLKIEGRDEFAELGETFNAMVARLEDSFSKLKNAYASLEQAHETQKRFTADASHELRTPLTRLRLATSSALAEGATMDDRRKALEVADAAAQSMGRLVQEMLVLARADAGQLTMRKERIDLRVVATDVLESLTPGSVEVVADLQDSPVMIAGDADHLRRVLSNLVDNALRYTSPGGSVMVSVCGDRDAALLKVADTGEGIAPEHLPHITERFYRADSARARADGGVGLGLAICKTIVEAHGGSLAIDSEQGRGTQVAIRLPIAGLD